MQVYIESMGCDSNTCDAYQLRQCLINNKITIVDNLKSADFIVFFSCGFNEKRLQENLLRLRDIKKNSLAKIILAGCMPKIKPETKKLFDYSIGPKEKHLFNKIFDLKIGIESFSPLIEQKGKATIRISTGCCGSCSYCAIKLATGYVKSRSLRDIVKDINEEVDRGATRIVLTSEDCGAWGQDISKDIGHLLRKIIKIRGNFKVSLTTINPIWFVKYPQLYNFFKSTKIDKTIYLSLQSASDRILKLMGREYSVLEYIKIFKTLKRKIPEIKIRSDFLVGFPTETNEDFEKTCVALKELDFYYVQIFSYTPINRTVAAKMRQIEEKIRIERAKKLINIFLSMHQLEKRPLVQTNINI